MSIQISARGGGGNKTERKPAWEYGLIETASYIMEKIYKRMCKQKPSISRCTKVHALYSHSQY